MSPTNIEDTFKDFFPYPSPPFPEIPDKSRIDALPPPRPLVDIFPPPPELLASQPPPELPLRTKTHDLDSLTSIGLKHSTHLFPASYLRSSKPPSTTFPAPPPSDASKETRSRIHEETLQRIMSLREEHEREVRAWKVEDGPPKGYESPIVWNVASRFLNTTRHQLKHTGLTLICVAANGFNKETWEPFIKNLWLSPGASSLIEEIWCFEFVSHGDAGIINRKALRESGIGTLFHLLHPYSVLIWFMQQLGPIMLVTLRISSSTSCPQALRKTCRVVYNA